MGQLINLDEIIENQKKFQKDMEKAGDNPYKQALVTFKAIQFDPASDDLFQDGSIEGLGVVFFKNYFETNTDEIHFVPGRDNNHNLHSLRHYDKYGRVVLEPTRDDDLCPIVDQLRSGLFEAAKRFSGVNPNFKGVDQTGVIDVQYKGNIHPFNICIRPTGPHSSNQHRAEIMKIKPAEQPYSSIEFKDGAVNRIVEHRTERENIVNNKGIYTNTTETTHLEVGLWEGGNIDLFFPAYVGSEIEGARVTYRCKVEERQDNFHGKLICNKTTTHELIPKNSGFARYWATINERLC